MFWLIVFYGANAIVGFSFIDEAISPVSVAAVHSLFNVVTTALLLPFSSQLERLAKILVPDRRSSDDTVMLDRRLLLSPGLALAQCRTQAVAMMQTARDAFFGSLKLMERFDREQADKVHKMEGSLRGCAGKFPGGALF